MSSIEGNKIFAAILVAGIVASLSGFTTEKLFGTGHGSSDAHAVEMAAGTTEHEAAPKPMSAEPILALIASADPERGKKLSRACASCHSFNNGGGNSTGPNLWNVVNRAKAGKDGFSYSDAMTQAGGDWSYAELNKFLWKPKKYIKGTKMNFVGIKKPADRAAMVAWLRTLSDAPAALPSAGDITGEESH